LRIIRETPNLLRLTRLNIVNCFLVRENDGFTLVDTNLPGSAEGIVEAVRDHGASIRRVALTHGHFDHVGSVDALTKTVQLEQLAVGAREGRLMAGDFSLDAGEPTNRLLGFPKVNSRPTQLLADGDRIGSLQMITSPGHTPGHVAFLDLRDGTLLAGDSFVTQAGVIAAGVFRFYFPLAAWFSWNRDLAAASAKKLRDLKPTRLAVGHGATVASPVPAMDRAVELAFRQSRKMLD
jgi:glyoxylase-like metal-dependent hydrolase (beta-lactamase superfamily II)